MKKLLFSIVVFSAAVISAETLDRPSGIKIGQRMTLRPYVSASATFDSNVGGRHDDKKTDVMWTVSPTLALDYRADNWSLLLDVFYNYHAYSDSGNAHDHNQHSYGETFRWNWSDTQGAEKGWSLMLSETYQRITMSDDIALGDGRGYTADRDQLTVQGAIQRRFNENLHGDVNANYYYLHYDNDTGGDIPALYGWQRWQAGLEAGFAPSQWTDFLISAGYMGYSQDNTAKSDLSRNSHGYTVQGGLGSYMTERISYRALAGWSHFEYGGDSGSSDDGFVYTLSGNWMISESLQTMLMASSYYQPSERELSSRSRVDALSWGVAKSFIRGKLRGTLDVTYRHETHEAVGSNSSRDYELDIATFRLGLNYSLNRFFSFFCYGEYQRSWNDESSRDHGTYDYDRLRGTVGVRLSY